VGLKSFEGKRDNLILNPQFNFEPMERFENWSDVRTLWTFGHSSICRIKNELETTELRLHHTQIYLILLRLFLLYPHLDFTNSSILISSVNHSHLSLHVRISAFFDGDRLFRMSRTRLSLEPYSVLQ